MSLQSKYPNIVGQTSVLNKLDFFVEIQNKTGFFPFVLFAGQRGSGKNTLSVDLSNQLKNPENSKIKPCFEINSATIEKIDDFYAVLDSYVVNKNHVTLIFDEFHAISKVDGLIDIFLSIFNTNNQINKISRNGLDYSIDKNKISFICMTSEPQMLPETLLSRMEIIQLEQLSLNELSAIIKKNLKEISAPEEVLNSVASVSRNNGRESFKLAENIYKHLKNKNKNTLLEEDWNEIKQKLGIRKHGINNIEFNILKFLNANPNGVSLSRLSSAMQLTADSCRLNFERFLLGNDFIEISAGKGRQLTHKGKQYINQYQNEH